MTAAGWSEIAIDGDCPQLLLARQGQCSAHASAGGYDVRVSLSGPYRFDSGVTTYWLTLAVEP